ncbi:MAG: methionine--tRNA ligase, partial [Solirubrobacteraceae bacterium]
NLASRSLAMVRRYRDGRIPDVAVDTAIVDTFAGLPDTVTAMLDEGRVSQALDEIWQRVRRLNRYVEEQAPWTLAKAEKEAPDDTAALDTVLRTLTEGVRSVAVLLHPWLPASTVRLLDALVAPSLAWEDALPGSGPATTVGELPPLFPKDRVAAG